MAIRYEAAYPKNPDQAATFLRPQYRNLIREIYRTGHERYEICQGAEICFAMEHLLENLSPRSGGFIEIGSAYGGSFHCWASIIDGPAISVDKINARTIEHGVSTPSAPGMAETRNRLWEESFPGRVTAIDGYSQEPATLAAVSAALAGRKVDFVFLDGDHSERITRLDFENYSKFVRPGGMIGFHDVFYAVHHDQCGKVFRELPLDKWDTGCHRQTMGLPPNGIGIACIK